MQPSYAHVLHHPKDDWSYQELCPTTGFEENEIHASFIRNTNIRNEELPGGGGGGGSAPFCGVTGLVAQVSMVVSQSIFPSPSGTTEYLWECSTDNF